MTDERDYTSRGVDEAFDEELPREPLGAHAEPAMPAAAPAPAAPAVPVTPAPAPVATPAHAAPGSFEPITEPEKEPEPVYPFEPATDTAPETPAPIEAIPDPTAPTSPEDTAEIDITAVEAQLNDPGSTQSFEPITDDLVNTDETFDAGTSSMLMWGARSDVGCVRNHNEDSYLVASPLFCVCDGMGGHAAGEVASAIAV